MDLKELTGMSELNDDFDEFYRTAVNKLGGPETFRAYIPFDMETLQKSHDEDPHFNTDLTPLRRWDNAAGNYGAVNPITRKPETGGGIWPILLAHDIRWMSLSQAVCLLKTAARMLLESENTEGGETT